MAIQEEREDYFRERRFNGRSRRRGARPAGGNLLRL